MVLMRNLWRVLVSIEAAGIDRPVFIVTLLRRFGGPRSDNSELRND